MTEHRRKIRRRRVLAGTGSLLLTGLAGCSSSTGESGNGGNGDNGGNSGNNGGNSDKGPKKTEGATVINVQANSFGPELVQVKKGAVVRWEHVQGSHTIAFYHKDNGTQHRVPKGAKAIKKPVNNGDKFFEVKLSKTGVYDYYCTSHKKEQIGSIIVGKPNSGDIPGLSEPNDKVDPFAAQRIKTLNEKARKKLGL